MEDLSVIEKELLDKAQKVDWVTILFFDLSSTATGYTLCRVDFAHKKAKMVNSGVVWFDKDWNIQEKIGYLSGSIQNYFNIIGKIDACFCEEFMINMKRRTGMLISPMLHGGVICALEEIGVKYYSTPVSTWRKQLGIKAIKKADGKRDFKTPCKLEVAKYIKVPEEIPSNITKKMRQTSHDLTDSIGICMGTLKQFGINHFDFSEIKFQESIDI